MRIIETIDELAVAFGGNRTLGEVAGVGKSAVSNWRRFGRLPPRLYLRIAAAARERGIVVPETLFGPAPAPATTSSETPPQSETAVTKAVAA